MIVSEGFLQALSGVWGNPLKREHGVPKEERGIFTGYAFSGVEGQHTRHTSRGSLILDPTGLDRDTT